MSLNRREMLLAAGAALLGPGVAGRALAQSKKESKKVLFFTKSAGFQHSVIARKGDQLSMAERILSDLPDITVRASPDPQWENQFDVLLSFEVLEHIEDDTAALRDWLRFLRPGGRLIISVPAHASRWTATDTWAGHVRRYDRADLIALAERCGVTVERCENYGFPLANVIEPVNAWAHARQAKRSSHESPGARTDGTAHDEAALRDARSAESGVRRSMETRLFPLMTSWPGRAAMRAACTAQRWFRRTEWGNGFLLQGSKRT